METARVQIELSESGVLAVTLSAAPANALSRKMISDLQHCFDWAREDDRVKVVLLKAPGRIFCAGHDMKEITAHRGDEDDGRAFLTDLFGACSVLMQSIATCPKPTICATEGIATAGGLQLLASCDIVLAAPSARFALPGVINGGFCTTPSVAVSRKIGQTALMEMALTGETFDADWALRKGLISRIVPQNALMSQATEMAKTLAARHAPAVQKGKQMAIYQRDLPLGDAYSEATGLMIKHFMDPHRIAKDKARW